MAPPGPRISATDMRPLWRQGRVQVKRIVGRIADPSGASRTDWQSVLRQEGTLGAAWHGAGFCIGQHLYFLDRQRFGELAADHPDAALLLIGIDDAGPDGAAEGPFDADRLDGYFDS